MYIHTLAIICVTNALALLKTFIHIYLFVPLTLEQITLKATLPVRLALLSHHKTLLMAAGAEAPRALSIYLSILLYQSFH